MPAAARQPPGDVGGVSRRCRRPAATGPAPAARPAPPPAPPPCPPRPATQPSSRAQRGELVPDQPGLLGVDPPGQVIVPGEPVRVLDRQLGLAHPAHALQRLHHRPVPGQQPLPHRHQQPVPAGEPRIARRDVPHPRHAPRQPRPGTAQPARPPACRAPGTPARQSGRRGPATASSSTRRACSTSTPNRSRNTSGRSTAGMSAAAPPPPAPAPAGPAPCPARAPRRRPLLGGVPGPVEIRRREQRHHPVAPIQRIAHRRHEVLARRPVPHIQLNRVPGLASAARPPTPPTPGPHRHD